MLCAACVVLATHANEGTEAVQCDRMHPRWFTETRALSLSSRLGLRVETAQPRIHAYNLPCNNRAPAIKAKSPRQTIWLARCNTQHFVANALAAVQDADEQ